MEVCETISGGSGEVFRGKMNENYPDKNNDKNKKHPIRHYKILFNIALNSLFNEWGHFLSTDFSCSPFLQYVA